jgi:Flp pilus assembly protein TadD
MKAALVPALLLALALNAWSFGQPGSPAHSFSPPTFNKDVAPILMEHCVPCHRAGQPVPFTLLSYADARPRAAAIARATESRRMPPWLPEPTEHPFLDERRLRDEHIEIIRRWVQAGALQGKPGDLAPVPARAYEWDLGRPDVIVRMPGPYRLMPGRRDVFRNVVLPLSLPSNRFVRAVEFRTGGAAIHHAVIRIDRTSASRRRDGADGQRGFDTMMPSIQDPSGHYLGWAPGRGAIVAPEGLPWRLDSGSDLVVELHLVPGDVPADVQPDVGLYFTSAPPVAEPVMAILGSKLIDIPAGQPDYTITDSYVLPIDVKLLSVYPHAHYLGKEMEARAVLPDGTVKPLLLIKQWSFHWQQDYRYVTPLVLPRGTAISIKYSYDNSDRNTNNPHRPPRRVMYGQRSADEMGTLGLQLLPEPNNDPLVLVRALADREASANVAAAEMLVRHDPNNVENHVYAGRSYVQIGRRPEAIAAFERAVALDPRSAHTHAELGVALLADRRPEDAVGRLRQAVALAPGDDQFRLELGKALYAAGDRAGAERELERAIALNPNFAEAHGTLGELLFYRDRVAEALLQFRRAVALAPDSAVAHSDLGAALAQSGQTEEALRHIRRALEIDPTYPHALENLVRLQRRR